MAYADQATDSVKTTAAPKQRSELRERAHSFLAAVEHLDVVLVRLGNMRDRLTGPVPEAVSGGSGKNGQHEPPLTTLYAHAAEDIENRISRIRQLIEDIERVI